MTAPSPETIASTHGYHPVTTDLDAILRAGQFDQLLVFGPGVGDVVDHVSEIRICTSPPVELPQGVYWFSGLEPAIALHVASGAAPVPSESLAAASVPEESALDHALAWAEDVWEIAQPVPNPLFQVNDDVIVDGTGQDGVVREGRRYVAGSWLYEVFSGGEKKRRPEASISPRPTGDDASTWVTGQPVSPKRFAATLTRAKLNGFFTNTLFSFRATRTLFRPYQFKPVQKLLDTGTLRLLIADEVGLGKTIEAGLVWTEMEARRQADRVLVVCPSSLVSKWKREMDERFGFSLVELTTDELDNLVDRLQTSRAQRRVAYVVSIERLRTYADLNELTELGLQFDLAIVDEAHAFRNSDTKSYELGEHIQSWSDALVMLSATPVNLHNKDLYNLLSLLVPGEFDDLAALEERIAPNRILHRITRSLGDPAVTNSERRRWLTNLDGEMFGRALMMRPEFTLLERALSTSEITPQRVVEIKRLCAELHGLSAQVTRTRKIDVLDEKPIREAHTVYAAFNDHEAEFYEGYLKWCIDRARLAGAPLNFAMQMPLRLAGSCLPETARYVMDWGRDPKIDPEEVSKEAAPASSSSGPPPPPELIRLARGLSGDTKFDKLTTAVTDLVRQERQAIIFTFSRRTLTYLAERLSAQFRVGTLHGGVLKRNRERVMADFRGGRFDILLATKVASEGLDFEFCSAVINYDLPWNPMEVEQRIGRIDRIGQTEKKIAIYNFNTPGTIETDIIERVMDRIEIFEHSIGDLEPIIESEWKNLETLLVDFNLSPEQRQRTLEQHMQAIEMQAKDRDFVEAAAPMLISSDSAEIDGLESDVLASGRYVGQEELGLLVQDWAETFGGRTNRNNQVLLLRGNSEMADHVQALVRTGERTSAEVSEVTAQLHSEQEATLALDQELSRVSEIPLLTATHALARAAAGTPGHHHGRFTLLQMSLEVAGVPAGTYLSLLAEVSWNGLRPLHEVWSSSINLADLSDAGDPLGLAIMKELAAASLEAAPMREHSDLVEAVELATMNLEARVATRRQTLEQENAAFAQTRRTSFEDVHRRRLAVLRRTRATNMERGNAKGIKLTDSKIKKQQERFEAQIAALDSATTPTLTTDDLAVCVVEVR